MELLTQIMEVIILPLLGILTAYAVKWVSVKIDEIANKHNDEMTSKYLNMLNETITSCVIATNQTYVETLKKQGSFDFDAQKIAFEQTYNSVINILSEDAKDYLTEAVGDLNLYIIQKIETEVNTNKTTN